MATTPVSLPVNQTSIWGVCDSGRRRKDLTSCSSQAQSPPLVEEGLPCARNCGSDTRGSGGARGRRVRAPRPGPCGAGGGSPISGAPSEKKDVTAAHDTENQRSGLTAALEDCRGHGAWRAISWGSKGQICSQRERGTPASGRVIPPRPSASPRVEPDTPSARSADVLPGSPRRRHPQTPAAVLCLRGAGCRVRGGARRLRCPPGQEALAPPCPARLSRAREHLPPSSLPTGYSES